MKQLFTLVHLVKDLVTPHVLEYQSNIRLRPQWLPEWMIITLHRCWSKQLVHFLVLSDCFHSNSFHSLYGNVFSSLKRERTKQSAVPSWKWLVTKTPFPALLIHVVHGQVDHKTLMNTLSFRLDHKSQVEFLSFLIWKYLSVLGLNKLPWNRKP